ncbi:MAG: IPTL-CTERM sorting domain-containing protein, partial [Acidobacteriota bacterium]
IDWNADGDWEDPGEQIATSLPLDADTTMVLDVPVPVGAPNAPSCARFRISSAGGLSSTGQAMDGEVEDYAVQIGVEDPVLGLGKRVIDVEQVGIDMWIVRYEMMVENLGNVPLSNIQIESDLATAYADADGFTVDVVTSGDLAVNPAFDGELDIFVLAGTDVLEIGETGTVIIEMTVMPGTEEGPYVCSSIGSGTSPDDEEVDDPSQDGGDPDPDNDGNPTDDNDPTVVEFMIPTTDIPTLGHAGLLLMALLLGIAAMRRMRV